MRNNATQTRAFSSSSSSSRSYSPSSSSSVLPQTPIRTMEQVWKDLSFFPHHPPPPPPINPNPNPNPNPTSSFRGVILQDFLAGPFKETPTSSSAAAHDHHHNDHEEHQFPLPLPPTALSLNSAGLDFEYNSRNGDCRGPRVNGAFVAPGFADAVIGSPPNVGLFSFCDQNRRASMESGGDRRHKRMMKNRESAARSRARKQAYTNELELEVAHLAAENEKLKKQYEELRLAMDHAQHSTKNSLQRTLTAPF